MKEASLLKDSRNSLRTKHGLALWTSGVSPLAMSIGCGVERLRLEK